MENSVDNSHVSETSKKSRSLDLRSLYVDKSGVSVSKEGAEGGELKSKKQESVEKEVGVGQGKKKRKSRKEVLLSSFEPVNKKSRNSLDSVHDNGLNLGSLDSSNSDSKSKYLCLDQKNQAKNKDVQLLADEDLHKLSGFNNVSHSLDESIPKRRRGFLRRKKFQNNHALEQVAASSDKVSYDTKILELNGDSVNPIPSSEGKQKKVSDGFDENSSSRANSARHVKLEGVNAIRSNGSPSPKSVQKNQRKRWELASQKQSCVDDLEPLVDNSDKICEDLQEDDEENLEQNAARMLSSRFDPSCTRFTGNSKASSASQSMNGFSLLPSVHQDFLSRGANNSVGSDSTSVDAAGRVLRPRKQHKEKGIVRKRRHFYEIFSGDLDAYWFLNRRIKVFWPLDKSWYFGVVNNYDPERKLHHVKYDDRDEEWIDLQNERFKLLLLPSEVPGKSGPEKSVQGGKHVDVEDVNEEDSNCIGTYMDSEPIISWLARSTRRIKSSPLGVVKRQKKSCPSKDQMLPVVDNPVSPPQRCFAAGPSRTDNNEIFCNSVLQDCSFHGEMAEKPVTSITCSDQKRLPFVYFRKRFRKRGQAMGCTSEEASGHRSLSGSVTSLALVVDRVGALEECDVTLEGSCLKDWKSLNCDSILWDGENLGLLRMTILLEKLKQVKLMLSFLPRWSHILSFEAEKFWLYRTVLLLHCGTVTTPWPKVYLEMLFVDNVAGLRFISFEGCLTQAVAFICLVLTAFCQSEYGELVHLQLPVTSIRFKLSGFQELERQFVFVVYNFLEVKNSKWLYLDSRLKKYSLVSMQLPLAECTYDNIKLLQNGSAQLRVPPTCGELISHESSRKRSRQGIMQIGVSKELASIDLRCQDSNSDENHWRLPSFVLSFAAAPTFFLSLHLKMLVENNVASLSFQNQNSMSLLEGPDCGRPMCDESIPIEVIPTEISEVAVKNNRSTLKTAAGSRWLSCSKMKVETDALSIGSDGDWIKTSKKYLNGELNVTRTSVDPKDSGKNRIDGIDGLQQNLSHYAGSEQCSEKSWPSLSEHRSSPDNSESRCFSLDGVNVQSPPLGQVENQHFDRETQNNQQSSIDSPWTMNDFGIRSPNPTAPRSVWHRNRHSFGSSSLGYRSKVWPDGKADFALSGFGNGSRKPRTQVSYLLPFGGQEFGSKPRSHQRKGRPYKRIRTDNEKRMSVGSRSPQRHPEVLYCDANVLITAGDRGWRESGAQVVLEFVDHKDWRILVKISGATRYSYKAHQFLQPGTTNRYTHAMMWKGGKDWILEFPDRSQWAIFRELHEECFNRNIRAATVKNIPIPGVRLIEESDDNAVEAPFIRSLKYFRQVETEVEMAMNPSHVLYDIESDDDEWISKHQNSSDIDVCNLPQISDDMFERTMDMFEKVAYAQQRDSFSSDEIEELMVGVGPVDVIKSIHEHWKQKRQKKGMPLIRQFQPPLWERYQQQVKEWELAINKIHNFPNGGKDKALIIEKPPMFAFCMRPRGLEVPNKGSKQRSQRKFAAGGGHNNAFSRDHDGLHGLGRRLNGFSLGEDRCVITGQSHEDASPWIQTSTRALSPRDAISTGYLSMSSDGSERNHHLKLHKNKSKKAGAFLLPSDSQMMVKAYSQKMTEKRNEAYRWNMGLPEWTTRKQYHSEVSQRRRVEQLGPCDLDEFRLRDASGAAQHAFNMAKLKREKAQRLLYRADLAIHKAVVALMTAEAIKASSEKEPADDG